MPAARRGDVVRARPGEHEPMDNTSSMMSPRREGSGQSARVGAYIVTYRRSHMLMETLGAVFAQTRPPDVIIVINNDPQTAVETRVHRQFPKAMVRRLARNGGSAGGFDEALRHAQQEGMDWAWMLDDDAVPYPDALAELLGAYDAMGRPRDDVGIMAPVQVSPRGLFGVARWESELVAVGPEMLTASAPFDVDAAYWAGLLVHRRVVETVGHPRSDFFRCFADYEYCLRARGAGLRVVAVPASRIRHNPGTPTQVIRLGRASLRHNYSPARTYYHVRNAAFTMRFVMRSPSAAVRHVGRQVRHALGDLIYDDRKSRRLWLRLLGLVDGFRGRLGYREGLE
jgi:rhamnopyranosyl-N-acetylglucosaminyl-diphospho-decaprenol beta-1,3/1,4-galactofuranosyltransferase